MRIPPELLAQLDARVVDEGSDRSKVAIAALQHYLEPDSSSELARLTARVTRLEALLSKSGQAVA